ncbi:MAG: hypothetical protein A3I77_03335 [Gammaproteobacteria bacterium RIFCSPLOWO2_02_FULL_42_14]|nr:MAG: hypothetical protein A3B71_01315 [Gammaproteobacteria bacterium RIFCSPHIGHO2_02_FULL_42_43]OGT28151.1 MAG: hypothetical protein A2624_02070 [Gammaproteobacteria bacterium RIFCSPHIGHO2_01_FULL_42_8]OGT51706.1 MAG: hypothetical protein A3E54_03530 [Gammaproteobacteria bacterium RIFCSPHIGHO2_12_FULL_41_25]OGT61603.1 MAG: hypothetical protein A3I77_03335 [Gammaproteobacteria bacterium RIFCSPLOWO2_02_FULL_42_14]OGT86227.1 MAG: hypothetical protein A3G86_06185 [Gammaproteobacteria bacterium R
MRKILAIVVMWMVCSSLIAAPINTTTISVPDRSASALQHAFQQGLTTVVLQMSGNPQIMALPSIQTAVSSASAWIQNYSYANDPASPGALQLTMTFDQGGLSELLRKSGQVVWRKDRPLTLVYLDFHDNALQNTFQQTAKADGISVIFPVMDLADENIIPPDNNAALPGSVMTQLGARYGVTSVLAAHFISQNNQVTQINWVYSLNGKTFQWTTTGNTPENMTVSAVYQLLQVMQQQLAMTVEQGARSSVTLVLNGVKTMPDFVSVVRDVRSKNDVRSVSVVGMNADQITLAVDITGTIDAFQKTLSADSAFSPIVTAGVPAAQTNTLQYFWTRLTT